MKALIFAAGLGTRLRPLTDNCPKALINVAGQPMLYHVIMRLKNAGIDELVINVHHLAPMIREYLEANNNFGLTIHISDESNLLLDTGGGILKAREWLDGTEPFVVHNADILTNLDIRSIIDSHCSTGADVTMAVSQRKSSRLLYFNKQNRLCGWKNLSTGETRPERFVADDTIYVPRAFNGIHVLSPDVFKFLVRFSKHPVFSIIPFYVTECHSLNIQGYEPNTKFEWYDIGKPATLEAAHNSEIARELQ